MEDIKMLKVKRWKETAKDRRMWRRPRQRWQQDVMEDMKMLKVKNGRKQLRIEEFGVTCLGRRKPRKGCSARRR
jgi:hypothetical protein